MGRPNELMAELVSIAREILATVAHTDNIVARIDMRTEDHSANLQAVANIQGDISRMADAFERLTTSAIDQIRLRSRFDWKFAFTALVFLGVIAGLLALIYSGMPFRVGRDGIHVGAPVPVTIEGIK